MARTQGSRAASYTGSWGVQQAVNGARPTAGRGGRLNLFEITFSVWRFSFLFGILSGWSNGERHPWRDFNGYMDRGEILFFGPLSVGWGVLKDDT